jgi:hypothetical protein
MNPSSLYGRVVQLPITVRQTGSGKRVEIEEIRPLVGCPENLIVHNLKDVEEGEVSERDKYGRAAAPQPGPGGLPQGRPRLRLGIPFTVIVVAFYSLASPDVGQNLADSTAVRNGVGEPALPALLRKRSVPPLSAWL